MTMTMTMTTTSRVCFDWVAASVAISLSAYSKSVTRLKSSLRVVNAWGVSESVSRGGGVSQSVSQSASQTSRVESVVSVPRS
eukprot:scaffold70912_cov59-Attheya_sp.AAC.1